MMARQALLGAWKRYYQNKSREELEQRASAIRERMMVLARLNQRMTKGFVRRDLETALGMSLGVHQQLLGGLTSASRGEYPRGWRGGRDY